MRMMTSSNGNIFRVTGPLCGEFTGSGEFPAQMPITVFSFICVWINDWVNNREAGDLRRHRGHCDVNVMGCARRPWKSRRYPEGRSQAQSYLTRDSWIIHHSLLPEYFSICYKKNIRNLNGNIPKSPSSSYFFTVNSLPPKMLQKLYNITAACLWQHGNRVCDNNYLNHQKVNGYIGIYYRFSNCVFLNCSLSHIALEFPNWNISSIESLKIPDLNFCVKSDISVYW